MRSRKSNSLLDMRRHWTLRQTAFDQIESNLTTLLGGKENLQTHTLSPYFHEIGRKINICFARIFSIEI